MDASLEHHPAAGFNYKSSAEQLRNFVATRRGDGDVKEKERLWIINRIGWISE